MADLKRRALGFDHGVAVSCAGRSGGLLCWWNMACEVEVVSKSMNHIDLLIHDPATPWRFTGFYGNPEVSRRHESWALLEGLSRAYMLPWVVGGDFNEICKDGEKQGGLRRPRYQMENFLNCLNVCNLQDLGFHGSRFTWRRKHDGQIQLQERLDRFCGSSSWIREFGDYFVSHEASSVSDHIPIFLRFREMPRQAIPRRFRFEKVWTEDPRLEDAIVHAWDQGEIGMKRRLLHCGEALNSWGLKVHGHVATMLKKSSHALKVAHRRGNLQAIVTAENELNRWLDKDDVYWSQRSRVMWLQNGDRNTRYFHAKASQRKQRNRIKFLLDEGGTKVEKQEDLARVAVGYFENLFASRLSDSADSLLGINQRVTTEMNEMLMQPFTDEEIKSVVMSMHPTKAPGPDGFPALFYQQYWHIVGEGVTHSVLEVLNNGADVCQWNETHIVLIPKCKNPGTMSEFRPISLCNVIYKIISKALANRLKRILPDIISGGQSAFVSGRQITDNVIISSECFHSLHNRRQSRQGFMALKLDVSKAYDRVDWSYLESIMTELGFCEGWIRLLMGCVCSVRFSVMINGKAEGHIVPHQGIRQGDPISPYLFLLCAEGFSFLLQAAEHAKRITGIQPSRHGPAVSHLLFADDSLIFAKASLNEALNIKQILEKYARVSGQHINLDKSSIIFSPCVRPSLRATIKDSLHLQCADRMGKYLGVPSLIGRSPTAIFQCLSDKVWAKANSWKEKFLSKAGKEVLVKSILQSIPTYCMSVFKLPEAVHARLTSIARNFWWSSKGIKRTLYWKSWDHLCKPKKFGGMGFRDVRDFNTALLAKQGWRIIQHPMSLMSRLLKAKYFPTTDFLGSSLGSNPSYVWRSIHSAKGLLAANGVWRLGDGADVRVWGHQWLPHRDQHGICGPPDKHQQTMKVAELIDRDHGTWRVAKVLQCLGDKDGEDVLNLQVPLPLRPDAFCWPYTNMGHYSVKSGYQLLRGQLQGNEEVQRLWGWIWSCQLTPTVRHFAWRLLSGVVPVRDILAKRGIALDTSCVHCDSSVETLDHCFIDCPWTQVAWDSCGGKPGYGSATCLLDWLSSMVNGNKRMAFRTSLAAMWVIWKCRNDKVFNGKQHLATEVGMKVAIFLQSLDHANGCSLGPKQTMHPQKWQPPPSGVIKLNCDAALHPSGRGGTGYIIRNHDGNLLQAAARRIDHCRSVKEAESLAMLEGLRATTQAGYPHVIVESDAQVLLTEITSTIPSLSVHGHLVADIKALASCSSHCSFQYIPRICNQAADRLAWIGSISDSPKVWIDNVPSFLSDVMVIDS